MALVPKAEKFVWRGFAYRPKVLRKPPWRFLSLNRETLRRAEGPQAQNK
jgi:hypothetical protein